MHIEQTAAVAPEGRARADDRLEAAIDALLDCARACSAAADVCVAETDPRLVQAVRMTLDCADVCRAAAQVATRRSGSNATVVVGLLMLAEALSRDCAAECARHADLARACRACAEVCARTEAVCREARMGFAPEPMQ